MSSVVPNPNRIHAVDSQPSAISGNPLVPLLFPVTPLEANIEKKENMNGAFQKSSFDSAKPTTETSQASKTTKTKTNLESKNLPNLKIPATHFYTQPTKESKSYKHPPRSPTTYKHPKSAQSQPSAKTPTKIFILSPNKKCPVLHLTSPSILRKPTHNQASPFKKVHFKQTRPMSNVCSTEENNNCLVACQRLSQQNISHQSSLPDFKYFQNQLPPSPLSQNSKSSLGGSHTTLDFFEFHPLSNFNQPQKKASSTSPRSASTLQQKFSWDESLQQLSKGLKNICGSPDAYAAKSFKRASSLCSESRRPNTRTKHLSASQNVPRTSLDLKNFLQNNLNLLKTGPAIETSNVQKASPSPTIFVSYEKDLLGLIPISDENQTKKDMDLKSNDSIFLRNDDEKKYESNSMSTSSLDQICTQNRRKNFKKQASMILQDGPSVKRSTTPHQAKKITVRHEELFQSLQKQLQRVLFNNTKINAKQRRKFDDFEENKKKNLQNKQCITVKDDDNDFFDGDDDDDKEDENDGDEDDDDGDEDDDDVEFVKNSCSLLHKIPLTKSKAELDKVFVEYVDKSIITYGVLCESYHQTHSKKSNYSKEILQKIKLSNKKPENLICTISKNLKFILLKEKTDKLAVCEADDVSFPPDSDHNNTTTHNMIYQNSPNYNKTAHLNNPPTHFNKMAHNSLNNDQFFLSLSESLESFYLPIVYNHTHLNQKFLTVLLKLPEKLLHESIVIKKIDDCVLISANKESTYNIAINEKTQPKKIFLSSKQIDRPFSASDTKTNINEIHIEKSIEKDGQSIGHTSSTACSGLECLPNTSAESPSYFLSFILPHEADAKSITFHLASCGVLVLDIPLKKYTRRFSF